MRERNRDKPSFTSFLRYTKRKSDGVIIESRNTPINYVDNDRMTDVVTPGFRTRSQRGEIINSPMTRYTSKYTDFGRSIEHQSSQYTNPYPHYVQHVPDLGATLSLKDVQDAIGRVEALAITEAYARVGEADVQMLTELAEFKETLSFLASPVRGMVRFTRRAQSWLAAAKRREASYQRRMTAYNARLARWDSKPPHRRGKKPKLPGKTPNPAFKVGEFQATDISSFWLAYRYGLMPLIYTFQDVQKALSREAKAPMRATARAKVDEKVSTTVLRGSGTRYYMVPPNCYADYKYVTEVELRVTARAGVLYAPDWSIPVQYGFQIHQIPQAMYEVIPLSFVADWFWNGSRAYQALTAHLRAVKIHAAWVVTSVEGDATVRDTITLNPSSGPGCSVQSPGTTGMTSISWKRRRPASLADVRVKMTVSLNSKRIADGLALIHTFMSRR